VYYGSEFGIKGEKGKGENADVAIRPCIDLDEPDKDIKLMKHIASLGAIRQSIPAVQTGSYAKMELKNQTFLFKRELNGDVVYVALNISDGDYTFRFDTKYPKLADRLSGRQFNVNGGKAEITVPKDGSMVLVDSELQPLHHEETAQTVSAPKPEAAPEVKKEEPPKVEPAPAAPEKPVSCVTPAADKGNGVRGVGVPDGRKAVLGGHYKHFKGGDYVLLSVAKDHETCDEIAVYMSLNGKPDVWARPLDMFLEDVDDHGTVKPRFELV
jgi:hypothetical protein